jgi:diguanylate cyclase (GGDEF)-like protein
MSGVLVLIKVGIEMLTKLKNELLFASVFQNSNEKVRKDILEDNRKAAIFWAVIQFIFWSFSLVMSRIDPEYTNCLPVYIIVLIISAVSLFLAIYVCPKHLNLVPAVATALNVALLGAGAGITLLKPNLRSAVIFCTLLIVPVSYITDTLSTIVLIVIDFLALVFFGSSCMDPAIFQWTVTFFVIFGTVGILMGHFINKTRFERYVFAESAMQLAELQTRYAYYDQMTGLQNRRAFSEKVEQLSRQLPVPCTVVMADINGLKEANDTLGHEAGDELIIGSAACLKKSFDGIHTIYRLGGDEFTVIMEQSEAEVKKRLERMEKICAEWKGQLINGISISYGAASTGEFSDADSLLKAADQRMYAYKNNYYQNAGKERRKR